MQLTKVNLLQIPPLKLHLIARSEMILLWIYVVKSSKYTIELRAHIREVCPTLI